MGTSDSNPLDVIGSSEPERRFDGDVNDLPEPPAPDEGRVERIGMDHRSKVAKALQTSDCQACGELGRWDREHVLAMVSLEVRMGFVRPRFCDRECWSEWTSRP